MNTISAITAAFERINLPDVVTAFGIKFLVGRTSRKIAKSVPDNKAFAEAMAARPIAEATDAANAQHYEVPAAFFALALGARRKYSCCLYDSPNMTLEQAEDRALSETMAHADLANGQTILELGCGWGSLSLTMAATFPGAQITAVSNSNSQRVYITSEAERRGLTNLKVITCDMNVFAPEQQFDRIVSVEMFEHMANWRALLGRVRSWLVPNGRLFLHVFSHKSEPYAFDVNDKADWIAQHFFTGGIMPSHGLIREYGDLFQVESEWQWNGVHYQKTALDWLKRYDASYDALTPILQQTYGPDAELWRRRWRLFFLATAGLFGFDHGNEWGVSHYRLIPVAG